VGDGLLRAIHTMNGAFAMTEVPSITEVTTPAEAYVRRLLAAQRPAEPDGVAAIEDVVAAIRGTLDALQSDSPRVPRFEALAGRLRALRDTLPEAQSPIGGALVVDEDGAPEGEGDAPDASGLDVGEAGEADLEAFDLSMFTGDQDDGTEDAAAGLELGDEDGIPFESVELPALEDLDRDEPVIEVEAESETEAEAEAEAE